MSQRNNIFAALANEDKVSSEPVKVSSEPVKVSSETANSVSRPKGNPWGNVRNSPVVDTTAKSDSREKKTTQSNVADVDDIVATLNKGGWTAVTSKKKVTVGDTSSNNASKSDKPRQGKKQFDKSKKPGNKQYKQTGDKETSTLGRNKSTLANDKQSSEKPSGSAKSISSVNSTSEVSESKPVNSNVSYASMASKPVVEKNVEKSVNPTTVPEVPFVTKKVMMSYASMALKPAVEGSQQKEHRKPQGQYQSQRTSGEVLTSYQTKTFNRQPTGPKQNVVTEQKQLPEHYIPRSSDVHSIQFSNTPFIKRVAGAEKSSSTAHVLYKLLVQYAIEFYSQPQLMMSTEYFRKMLTGEDEDSENVFLLVLSQVIALIVHRLIRSDSDKIIEMIFDNIPLFDVVPETAFRKISQTDASASENTGHIVYERIRSKWFADMRVIKGFGKSSETITEEDVARATERISAIKSKMLKAVYQSEWNGNNLFHSAMYYGSKTTLGMLFRIGTEHKLHSEMHRMLCVKNGVKKANGEQGESYNDILSAGIAAASNDKQMFGIRRLHFEECKRLYTVCLEVMRKHLTSIVDNEAKAILKESGIEVDGNTDQDDTENPNLNEITEMFASKEDEIVSSASNVFDTTNVIEMLQTGNMEAMIDYIVNHHKLGNFQTIRSTVSIWENVAKTDSSCQDYLTDVLEFADIESIIREIFPEKFVSDDSVTASR
jgi:hypothetical protein